jgi:hypothetical protein
MHIPVRHFFLTVLGRSIIGEMVMSDRARSLDLPGVFSSAEACIACDPCIP